MVRSKRCLDCNNRGWAVFLSDTRGLEIEKCDSCDQYADDVEATDAGLKAILKAMKAAHESLTLVVAEGGDKCDPEGVSHALSALAEILTDQFEMEART
ncbi:MAG: hypothetical protein ABFE07_28345 [Armatimonadia bacterium]